MGRAALLPPTEPQPGRPQPPAAGGFRCVPVAMGQLPAPGALPPVTSESCLYLPVWVTDSFQPAAGTPGSWASGRPGPEWLRQEARRVVF